MYFHGLVRLGSSSSDELNTSSSESKFVPPESNPWIIVGSLISLGSSSLVITSSVITLGSLALVITSSVITLDSCFSTLEGSIVSSTIVSTSFCFEVSPDSSLVPSISFSYSSNSGGSSLERRKSGSSRFSSSSCSALSNILFSSKITCTLSSIHKVLLLKTL